MDQPNLAAKVSIGIIFVCLLVMSAALTSRALASGVGTALYRVDVNVSNTGETGLVDVQAPFEFSIASLIDGKFIEADGLNSHLHSGSVDVPHMPPTNRIQVEGAIQNDGGVFTEYTTAAQDTTTGDLPLLPAVPAVDDAWYQGCDNPCRILTHEIATAGAGTWTLTYEYWDGSAWAALSNIDDRTTGFTAAGQNIVSWAMPGDWATRTVTGSSVSSYWSRARVSAFTSISTQPLGTRERYETGQWWTWVESLGANDQSQSSLFLGGTTDLQSSHQTFPGTDGIITGDAGGLELGASYSVGFEGRLDFGASGLLCVVCKTNAFTLNVTGAATAPAIEIELKGGGTTTATLGATGSGTGTHQIVIGSDGTDTVIWVADNGSGGLGNMIRIAPQTITDNANNYSWATNGGVDYFEWVRIDAAEATIFDIDITQAQFAEGTLDGTEAFTDGLGLSGN